MCFGYAQSIKSSGRIDKSDAALLGVLVSLVGRGFEVKIPAFGSGSNLASFRKVDTSDLHDPPIRVLFLREYSNRLRFRRINSREELKTVVGDLVTTSFDAMLSKSRMLGECQR